MLAKLNKKRQYPYGNFRRSSSNLLSRHREQCEPMKKKKTRKKARMSHWANSAYVIKLSTNYRIKKLVLFWIVNGHSAVDIWCEETHTHNINVDFISFCAIKAKYHSISSHNTFAIETRFHTKFDSLTNCTELILQFFCYFISFDLNTRNIHFIDSLVY